MPCRWTRSTGQRASATAMARRCRAQARPLAASSSGPASRGTATRVPAVREPSQATTSERWPAATSARSSAVSTCSAPPTGVDADRRQRIGDAEDGETHEVRSSPSSRDAASTRAMPPRAGHAPVVALVVQIAAVRQGRKIVCRRDAEALGLDIEERQHLGLRAMRREHLPFHGAVAVAERQHRLDGGGRRREALHRPAVPVGAVEGHLDDRDLAALAPQQLDRGMDGEGGGVMVGMAALIGMGQHDPGRPLQEQAGEARARPAADRSAASWSAMPRPTGPPPAMPASIMTRSSSASGAKAYSATVAKPCLAASCGLRGAPSVTWTR